MPLGCFPTPVERIADVSLTGELWLKRDDLNAPAFGGNKVRALEFLLGGLHEGDRVLTLGGEGSTHVLATAAHAAALGVRTTALRWPHDMHPVAREVAARAAELCERIEPAGGAARAMLRAALRRRTSGERWISLGGTSPVGMLGHVNAGLELAEQVRTGECPAPTRVVVPLGSGGTAAGVAVGFQLGGLDTVLVGARVGPRMFANALRVRLLAARVRRMVERLSGETLPRLPHDSVEVVHDVYGGAYGRPLPRAAEGEVIIRREAGVRLDATYSAKAFAAALSLARRGEPRTLFWLTFDSRWMRPAEGNPSG